jgi:hypothetical protein
VIHIEYPGTKAPPNEWLTKAEALTAELKAAADKTARDKIIDQNAAIWGEIKEWLQSFSYGKCWFSEARDTYSHWQVEHFRPKKEAKDPDRDGYWWRAFDYLNYRLCGGVGNAKKGSYFPLRAGTTVARGPDDDCEDEAPLLIDPTVASDVILLSFAEGGIAVPSESDGWPRERAEESIKRYKLNAHPPLTRARADVWNQCHKDVTELEILMAKHKLKESATNKEKIRQIVIRLKDRTAKTAPFSSVARAFLLKDPRPWVSHCVD